MSLERFNLLSLQPEIIQLSNTVNHHPVFMYRDNPDDFAFGGNKVRFFEYLIPAIIEAAPQVLVTSGSPYSNHIRVTAEVAARLNLRCELLITEDSLPEPLTANLAIAEQLGAKLICVGHFAALLKINEHMEQLKTSGEKAFLVPNGGHTPGAVRAYRDVIAWTFEKLDEMKISPAAIFLPCASGTTHAGVLAGASVRKLPPVFSFAVANTPVKAARGISRLLGNASEFLPDGFKPDDVTVKDCGKNDYGKPDNDLLLIRDRLRSSDNIELDPTYNINAFFGMKQTLESMAGDAPVLYINTGGYTGLNP